MLKNRLQVFLLFVFIIWVAASSGGSAAQQDVAMHTLTHTMGTPVGAVGFYGAYALDDGEMVDIVVQFATPPYVALRHLQDMQPAKARAAEAPEAQALAAHDAFGQQLSQMIVPFDALGDIEILSAHHRLFNGVFMRVPASMVACIAALPEVFAVTPDVAFYPMFYPTGIAAAPMNFFAEVRDVLGIDYIANHLGITGEGVRVAVLDTGIDHTHPVFADFLDDTNRVPGWDHHDNAPSANPAHTARGHGTAVTGALVGIAPGVELWHYRVALANGGGGMSVFAAIEAAHAEGMQIINLSFGAQVAHPFTPVNALVNVAVLDGVVVVASAGNAGQGGAFTLAAPANAALAIAVGSATNDRLVADFSSRGPVAQTYHIKPDVVAPGVAIQTTDLDGRFITMNGTSISAPIVSGVAALLLQAFPDAAPCEIKARLMNTAQPLVCGVWNVGAGWVDPLAALNAEAFAIARHYAPLTAVPGASFEKVPMSSLSFGSVYGGASHEMVVTVHGSGEWEWVPQVLGIMHEGVTLRVREIGPNTFAAYMLFSSDTAAGLYAGTLAFTNGEKRLSLPFSARFEGGGVDWGDGWRVIECGNSVFYRGGERVVNDWIVLDGFTFRLLPETGHMAYGLFGTGGWTYHGVARRYEFAFATTQEMIEDGTAVGPLGSLHIGLLDYDDMTFYFLPNGLMRLGFQTVNNVGHYFHSITGQMMRSGEHGFGGWISINTSLEDPGSSMPQFLTDDEDDIIMSVYFDNEGKQVFGEWITTEWSADGWYRYAHPEGGQVLVNQYFEIDGVEYWFNEGGFAQRNSALTICIQNQHTL